VSQDILPSEAMKGFFRVAKASSVDAVVCEGVKLVQSAFVDCAKINLILEPLS
jgi:hypothetical protein